MAASSLLSCRSLTLGEVSFHAIRMLKLTCKEAMWQVTEAPCQQLCMNHLPNPAKPSDHHILGQYLDFSLIKDPESEPDS